MTHQARGISSLHVLSRYGGKLIPISQVRTPNFRTAKAWQVKLIPQVWILSLIDSGMDPRGGGQQNSGEKGSTQGPSFNYTGTPSVNICNPAYLICVGV